MRIRRRRSDPLDSAAVRRVRPGRVVPAVVLTEAVLVAGLCNQLVTRSLGDYASRHGDASPDYTLGTIRALATFAWSFAPIHHEARHVWAAQLAAIGALLVLTALLVTAVIRATARFWQVLVAVWGVVAAATPLAVVVRGLVAGPVRPQPNTSRLGQALFEDTSGPVVVAGLVLGLVLGLVAAVTAMLSRAATGADTDAGLDADSDAVTDPTTDQIRAAETDPTTDQIRSAGPGAPEQFEQPVGAGAGTAWHREGPERYGAAPWHQPGPDTASTVNAQTLEHRPPS